MDNTRTKAQNVLTQIETVELLKQRGEIGIARRSGATFGRVILRDLPGKVSKFVYSGELPEITAERQGIDGSETWNAIEAMTWAAREINPEVRIEITQEGKRV